MAAEPAAPSGVMFGRQMGNIAVSWVRLSSAATLYSLAQIQTAVELLRRPGSLPEQVHSVEATVNSLADCLVERISESKKNSLQSLTETADVVVRQSFAILSLFDPQQFLRLADRLVAGSSETISDWMRKPEPAPVAEPKLAVDVLVPQPPVSRETIN